MSYTKGIAPGHLVGEGSSSSSSSSSSAASSSSQGSSDAGDIIHPSRDDSIVCCSKIIYKHIVAHMNECRSEAQLVDEFHSISSNLSTPARTAHPVACYSVAPSGAAASVAAAQARILASTTFSCASGSVYSKSTFDIENFVQTEYTVTVPLFPKTWTFESFRQKRKHVVVPNPDPQQIYNFIKRIFDKLVLTSETMIIALIYIERLQETKGIPLTSRNWIPLVVVALLVASKVWDDLATFNAEFSLIVPFFPLRLMNKLEREFMDAMDFNFSVLSTEYARYYFGLSSVRHQPSKAISTQYLNTVTTSGRKSVGTGVPIAGSVPVTATAMNRAPSNLNEYQPPRINQMSPFMRELPGPVNHNSNNSNISSSGSKEQTAFYSSSRAMSSSAIALASSPIKEDSPDLLNMSKMVQSTSNSSIGIPLQTGQTASPSYTAFPDAGIEDEEDDSENNSLYVRGKRVSSYSINSPPITANVGI